MAKPGQIGAKSEIHGETPTGPATQVNYDIILSSFGFKLCGWISCGTQPTDTRGNLYLTCRGFLSVINAIISNALLTMRIAKIFFPLLRPCIIREFTSLSTSGHCAFRKRRFWYLDGKRECRQAINIGKAQSRAGKRGLAHLPAVCGVRTTALFFTAR